MCFIIISLLTLAGIANGGMDVLTYSPKRFIFQTDWWLVKGKFAWNKRKWYTKYIFTMFSDGWHFLKFINIICYILAIVLAFGSVKLSFTLTILHIVAGYTYVGAIFELAYNYIWRKR